MISLLLHLAVPAGLGSLPCEYVIDPGVAPLPHANLVMRFEARDGSVMDVTMGIGSPSITVDPDALRHILEPESKDTDGKVWLFRRGPGNSVVATGTRTSPIRSVTVVKTDGWKPEIRWVPLLGKK